MKKFFVLALAILTLTSCWAALDNSTQVETQKQFSFLCEDNHEFSLTYTENWVDYTTANMTSQLEKTQAASGEKYENDEMQLHIKGEEALIIQNNQTVHKNCVAQ